MSLDLFAQFATDETLENNGTWREIGGGVELLIARTGNRRYAKLLTKLVEQHRKVLDMNNDFADKKSDEIMLDVMANYLLLDWRTKEGDAYQPWVMFKKKQLPYSVENAKKLLGMADFRRLVAKFADEADAFRLKEEEEQGEA